MTITKEQLDFLHRRMNDRLEEFGCNRFGHLYPGIVRVAFDVIEEWWAEADHVPAATIEFDEERITNIHDAAFTKGWQAGRESIRREQALMAGPFRSVGVGDDPHAYNVGNGAVSVATTPNTNVSTVAPEPDSVDAATGIADDDWCGDDDEPEYIPTDAETGAAHERMLREREQDDPSPADQWYSKELGDIQRQVDNGYPGFLADADEHDAEREYRERKEEEEEAAERLALEEQRRQREKSAIAIGAPLIPRRAQRREPPGRGTLAEADDLAAESSAIIEALQSMAVDGEMPAILVWDGDKPAELPTWAMIQKRHGVASWAQMARMADLEYGAYRERITERKLEERNKPGPKPGGNPLGAKMPAPVAPAVPRRVPDPDVARANIANMLAKGSGGQLTALATRKPRTLAEVEKNEVRKSKHGAFLPTLDDVIRELKRQSMAGMMPSQSMFNDAKPGNWAVAVAQTQRLKKSWEELAKLCGLKLRQRGPQPQSQAAK